MTHAELTAAVAGSLQADEQRQHRHDAPARMPATRECEYCDGKGTKTGPNGESWRCHACKGRGRLIDQPTPG